MKTNKPAYVWITSLLVTAGTAVFLSGCGDMEPNYPAPEQDYEQTQPAPAPAPAPQPAPQPEPEE
jgi:PBP1b-binding outer membrane lipoprotein LpoB